MLLGEPEVAGGFAGIPAQRLHFAVVVRFSFSKQPRGAGGKKSPLAGLNAKLCIRAFKGPSFMSVTSKHFCVDSISGSETLLQHNPAVNHNADGESAPCALSLKYILT